MSKNSVRGAKQQSGLIEFELTEYASWIEEGDPIGAWYNAFDAIDRRGNKEPLIRLLNSNAEIETRVRECLVDLLQRYQLKRVPGRPRIPIYNESDQDARLGLAKEAIRARGKLSLDEAIPKIAAEYGIDARSLRAHHEGKRGSTRRTGKRGSAR